MSQATPSKRPASTWARIGASLIDWVCMLVVGIAVVNLAWGLNGTPERAPLALAFGCAGLVYEVSLTAWRGQTVGKRIARIVVVDDHDEVPSVARSLFRYLVKTLSPFGWFARFPVSLVVTAYGVALLGSIAVNPYRRGWHDRIAGTSVMEVAGRKSTSKSITKTIAQGTPQAELEFVRRRTHRRRPK